jgi:hypothetical protein
MNQHFIKEKGMLALLLDKTPLKEAFHYQGID